MNVTGDKSVMNVLSVETVMRVMIKVFWFYVYYVRYDQIGILKPYNTVSDLHAITITNVTSVISAVYIKSAVRITGVKMTYVWY